MENLLQIRNLQKIYPGNVVALRNVSIDIGVGRIVGLLGPNGCGKTTLIKILTGLLKQSSGTVSVGGHPVGVESKKLISYLPDKVYFNDWMRVRDMMNYFADFFADFQRPVAQEMLKTLNISENLLLKSLSKGTKEKVQLALAMSRRAKLYILDEPIAGVDPAARDYILHTILQNYNRDASILIATHLISDVQEILDDVIFLKYGDIVLNMPRQQAEAEKGKSVVDIFKEVFKCY